MTHDTNAVSALRLEELLTLLISDSIVLPIDLASTRQYAKVRNELRAQGTPMPCDSASCLYAT